jgi:hypothetical protein
VRNSHRVIPGAERLDQGAVRLTVQRLAHHGPNYSVIVEFDTTGGVPKMGLLV